MTNLVPRLEFALQSLVKRSRACPHCRARDTRVVARKHVVVRVRRCAECGLCFTDPLYESSAFGRLYDALYDAEGSTTALPGPAELERLRATRFAGTDKDFAPRLRFLRELARGPRLVELGSSWGYFVHQARAAGFDAVGVEIGRLRREYGVRELGVPLVESLADLGARRFDVAYTAHVLEHFTDLSTVFDELYARLAPGGFLALEVPHFDLAGRGRAALANVGAVHPLGFTREFFERNLPRHGFEPVALEESWEALAAAARGAAVERPAAPSGVLVALARRPGAGAGAA